MATEYRLSYTAEDIDEKLGKINNLSKEKADKSYLVTVFEDLRTAILAGDTETSIAILDSAILDLSTLG